MIRVVIVERKLGHSERRRFVSTKRKQKRPVSLARLPGYDGAFEAGEREVDDPFEPGAKLKAAVNVKATVLDHMRARHRIDGSQQAAGERFTALFKAAAIGRQKAIDYVQPAVDGGSPGDPLSDSVVEATKKLNQAILVAGPIGSRMLLAVLGEGKGIRDVARAWSAAGGVISGERAEGYVTGTFVDALNTLVELWGMQAVGSARQHVGVLKRPNGEEFEVKDTIRATGDMTMTGPSREVVSNRFGDLVSREIIPDRDQHYRVHSAGGGRRR